MGKSNNIYKKDQTLNPYSYTARENDTNELYYYRARYYDPSLKTFISQDPIGYASGDYNWYRYVGNNPVSFIDPLGLAKACYRALKGTRIIIAPKFARKRNIVLGHQQIIFDDGSSIGYGDNGIMNKEDIRNYTFCTNIDASKTDIMKIANELFKKEFTASNYDKFNHNCQDFVDRVREKLKTE